MVSQVSFFSPGPDWIGFRLRLTKHANSKSGSSRTEMCLITTERVKIHVSFGFGFTSKEKSQTLGKTNKKQEWWYGPEAGLVWWSRELVMSVLNYRIIKSFLFQEFLCWYEASFRAKGIRAFWIVNHMCAFPLYMHTYVHACICAFGLLRSLKHVHAFHACIRSCIHTYVCACVYVYRFTYVYMNCIPERFWHICSFTPTCMLIYILHAY